MKRARMTFVQHARMAVALLVMLGFEGGPLSAATPKGTGDIALELGLLLEGGVATLHEPVFAEMRLTNRGEEECRVPVTLGQVPGLWLFVYDPAQGFRRDESMRSGQSWARVSRKLGPGQVYSRIYALPPSEYGFEAEGDYIVRAELITHGDSMMVVIADAEVPLEVRPLDPQRLEARCQEWFEMAVGKRMLTGKRSEESGRIPAGKALMAVRHDVALPYLDFLARRHATGTGAYCEAMRQVGTLRAGQLLRAVAERTDELGEAARKALQTPPEERKPSPGPTQAKPPRVLVNGKEIEAKVPPRVENGVIVGPIRPVAEAMGAEVTQYAREPTLAIKTKTQGDSPWWADHDLGPTMLAHEGYIWPYDLASLGPVLTVRHYLSELQWASLSKPPDSPDPILGRFEILKACTSAVPLGGHTAPLKSFRNPPFRVTAMLYWLLVDPDAKCPRSAMRVTHTLSLPPGAVEESAKLQALEREIKAQWQKSWERIQDESRGKRPTGGLSVEDGGFVTDGKQVWRQQLWRLLGPPVRAVRIEEITYVLKPKDVLGPRDTEDEWGPMEELFQGASGWMVDEAQTTQLSTRTFSIDEMNNVVPVYDISAQKFPLGVR